MSSIFKKSAIALAVLGFAGIAYAGTLTGGFVGFEGLDLQSRNGDLDYVTSFPVLNTDDVYVQSLRPNYHWGFRLFGGLRFCGNDDVAVSWQRFHNSFSDSYGTPISLAPGVPSFTQPRWLSRAEWTNINSNVSFNLDDVYGVFGHTLNFRAWSFRYASGVEWARLDSDMNVRATIFDDVLFPNPVGFKSDSHWNGVGPRFEAGMAYPVPYGFSLFASGNLSLLISSRNVSLNSVNTVDGDFHPVEFTNRLVVVPKVGMRLGLGYSYVFGPMGGEGAASCMKTTVSVAAGWQAESYIHAIERPVTGNGPSTGVGLANITTKVSNFGDQGLFLGVKVGTDWA